MPGPVVGFQNVTLLLTLAGFAEGRKTVGAMLRDTLLQARTFEEAIPLLSDTPLASPIYLIVSGRDRGAVLTRDREGPSSAECRTRLHGGASGAGAPRQLARSRRRPGM